MSISYGRKSKRITASDINQIIYANGTVLEQGVDGSGGYYVKFQFDTSGCGSAPAGYIRVELKDTIPWSNVSYEVYNVGNASCWSYNEGSYAGNLLPFNASTDRLFNTSNSFELSQFTKQMTACDNNSTNFMHASFKVGTANSFFVTRRRNVGAGLGQVVHQRSCNSIGAGSYVILRNIFVY